MSLFLDEAAGSAIAGASSVSDQLFQTLNALVSELTQLKQVVLQFLYINPFNLFQQKKNKKNLCR